MVFRRNIEMIMVLVMVSIINMRNQKAWLENLHIDFLGWGDYDDASLAEPEGDSNLGNDNDNKHDVVSNRADAKPATTTSSTTTTTTTTEPSLAEPQGDSNLGSDNDNKHDVVSNRADAKPATTTSSSSTTTTTEPPKASPTKASPPPGTPPVARYPSAFSGTQCNVTRIMRENRKNNSEWTTTKADQAAADHSSSTSSSSKKNCAILFFGLPRTYRKNVLPSIIKNVLIPNVENHCDYYLHYHAITLEAANRGGIKAGIVQGDEVFLLEDALKDVYRNHYNRQPNTDGSTSTGPLQLPLLSIINSTEADFYEARNKSLHTYETERDVFFPNAGSWIFPTSIRNMIKQWDSIENVWFLMEDTSKKLGKDYDRIAMLRNDVVFVAPIDVYGLPAHGNRIDIDNTIVVPGWGKYPVNDRMVIGPTPAVKVWATERFDRIEESVRSSPKKVWQNNKTIGMHSEEFMSRTIFPAMVKADKSYKLRQDPELCFLRTYAEGSVKYEDCFQSPVYENCDMSLEIYRLLTNNKYNNRYNESSFSCHKKPNHVRLFRLLICEEN